MYVRRRFNKIVSYWFRNKSSNIPFRVKANYFVCGLLEIFGFVRPTNRKGMEEK